MEFESLAGSLYEDGNIEHTENLSMKIIEMTKKYLVWTKLIFMSRTTELWKLLFCRHFIHDFFIIWDIFVEMKFVAGSIVIRGNDRIYRTVVFPLNRFSWCSPFVPLTSLFPRSLYFLHLVLSFTPQLFLTCTTDPRTNSQDRRSARYTHSREYFFSQQREKPSAAAAYGQGGKSPFLRDIQRINR